MAYESVKNQIDAYIKANGVNLITGPVLNAVLTTMLDELGEGYAFQGVLDTTDTPSPAADIPQAWLASAGTYLGGSITVDEGELALIIHTSDGWSKETVYRGVQLSYEAIVAALGYTPADDADLAEKQDTIADLSSIRSGAALGETSVQPADIENMVEAEPIGSIIPPVNPSEFATKEEVSQLGQDLGEIVTSTQSSNLFDLSTITSGYFWWTHGPIPSSEYSYSDKIPVTPGETYTVQRLISSNVRIIAKIRMIVGYKADGTLVTNGAFENVSSYTAPEDCAYIILTDITGYLTKDYAFVKSTAVIPYEEYGRIVNFKENVIKSSAITDGAVTTGKLADGGVTIDKVSFKTTIYGKNLLDPEQFHTEKWVGPDGDLQSVTTEYGYYDYLPVSENTDYHISNADGLRLSNRSDCYIAFYDADKTFISSVASNTTDVTTPANAAFIRISVVVSKNTSPMMELGTERTEYVPYVAPQDKIDPDYIVIPDEGVKTQNIEDGAVTQEKLSESVSLPSRPYVFKGFFAENASLATGNTLQGDLLYITKNTLFAAIITGTIQDVECGIGYGSSSYIGSVEITSENVVIKRGSETATYAHGLTLGQRVAVSIAKNNELQATIKIFSELGGIYSNTIGWGTLVGKPFVSNKNLTGSIGANLCFMPRDINQRIWMFGDSYFDYVSSTRWPYYMLNWGYSEWLADARPGENATEALADFNKLLTSGERPSFAVWCMGMNAGRDTDGAVNPTWLQATQSFLSKCEELHITPILATIPSVPTEIHTKLNEWVVASGYRYIDFAKAVENGIDYYWKGWETADALLSSDEVHPSTKGGIILATQVLVDFPEITIVQ